MINSPLKTPPKGAAGAPPSSAAPDPGLTKAAQAFEALILKQMIAAMRSAKLADDPLSSGAETTFRDISDARLADTMAASGLGISAMLQTQFGGKDGAPT
jgi:peptidoglycan hydrolase FlgJ